MRLVVFFGVALMALSGPAAGYDADSQAVIDRFKPGKLVPIADVGVLMMGAERWCYNQQGSECAWSDIYLWVEGDRVGYELSNPWSEGVDISFVDEAEFRDGRYICETGFDWLPSVRAFVRGDGMAIEGRDLAALKAEIATMADIGGAGDCFDYLYRGHDAEAQTVTLLQRQFVGGVHEPVNDAEVTLHFDKAKADGLGWYL
ncbi:MAG: hypothetical protein ABS76_30055 [Pelagibacterium sp. SCN 64-44]|nr:MAG: hypothetical protein ABS76_30055 [Pelagibacterium sp. SCN 64-44]